MQKKQKAGREQCNSDNARPFHKKTRTVWSKIKLQMAWNIPQISSLCIFVILALFVHSTSCEKGKDVDVKNIAEEWFTQQAVGSLGKKFLEKVKCSKFISHFQEKYPEHYGTSTKYSKDQISSVVSELSLLFNSICTEVCSLACSIHSAISSDRLNETEETCRTMQFAISRILRKPSFPLVQNLPTIS